MHALNITKVAVGCADAEVLRDRLIGRAAGGESTVHTRYRPRRADELVGGSLFWIIGHRLVVRSPILGFAEDEQGHCLIRVADRLHAVRPQPRRAHQGWRYLAGPDSPADLGGGAEGTADMPPDLLRALADLALL